MRAEFRPYVTNDAWQHHPTRVGRPDTIDDVADQFERPAGAEQFWSQVGAAGSVVHLDEWSARHSAPAGESIAQDVAHG